MRRWMSQRAWLKRTLLLLFICLTLSIIALITWIAKLDRDIQNRFAQNNGFAPPVEFYSAPEKIKAGYRMQPEDLERTFNLRNFVKQDFGRQLQNGEFSIWTSEQCLSIIPELAQNDLASLLGRCIAFRNRTPNSGISAPALSTHAPQPQPLHMIAFTTDGTVLDVFTGTNPIKSPAVELEPELFAQYYGNKPFLQKVVPLGEAPVSCLNALLAIEDAQFLEHPGVSVTGLFRAVIKNLVAGRKAQGGSTITQQLVKNYFLTDEKTMKRKLIEIVMAFLVERHASKDKILETYINLIYMGQNGPFEVRGFAAAAEHYFGKPLNTLNLDQCALLAAVLNSPGLYNPFKYPDRALKRRALVVDRMSDLKMIEPSQAELIKAAPLPSRPQRSLTEPAPYFIQVVRRDLLNKGIDESEGLRVFTTLNLRAQEAAHQAVRQELDRLETTFSHIKKLKASGKNLEAVLISADPTTGHVQALVGGRGYLATQFNRAVDSRRQVGSVMKPFVYLTALESLTPEGEPYTPLTLLQDRATTYKFEGQTWSPRNYDSSYQGEVPLFYALKESLNASTVGLGVSVGLDNIVDTTRRLGVTSTIKPLPSLTLGAFELTPLEVLQAYGSLARFGNRVPLSYLDRVESLDGHELYRFDPRPEPMVAPETAAVLVGIMKQTLQTGTGRASRSLGFTKPAAGKTGTTNDKKDAWFAGFTPEHVAVAWVGYDDNTSHNLTGASGAVPLWTAYMKAYTRPLPDEDFTWPAGTQVLSLTREQQLAFGVPEKKSETLAPTELVFRSGQVPPALIHAPAD